MKGDILHLVRRRNPRDVPDQTIVGNDEGLSLEGRLHGDQDIVTIDGQIAVLDTIYAQKLLSPCRSQFLGEHPSMEEVPVVFSQAIPISDQVKTLLTGVASAEKIPEIFRTLPKRNLIDIHSPMHESPRPRGNTAQDVSKGGVPRYSSSVCGSPDPLERRNEVRGFHSVTVCQTFFPIDGP
jgi:hypothetical protein